MRRMPVYDTCNKRFYLVFFECVYFRDISGMNIEQHKALDATNESLVQSKSQIGVRAVVKFLGTLLTARQCFVLCIVCV